MPSIHDIRVKLLTPCDLLVSAIQNKLNEYCIQTDADTTLSNIRQHEPDLVLLDETIDRENNLSAILQFLRKRWPRAKVVIFAANCYGVRVHNALNEGASGYLCLKDNLEIILPLVIQQVMRDNVYLSPNAQKALSVFDQQNMSLTPYQEQVLIGLAQGKDVSQIAQELGRSTDSVYQATAKLRQIFQVQNNSQLIEQARKNGWIISV